jgi:DNA-binding LacI/PurR family transcriptional regulator
MKNKAQSIYDLAAQTGVSASTVSRVLNGRQGIGEATRRKVLASARAQGFRPRMVARRVTVAVVVDRYQFASLGGFVSTLLSHLVEMLSKRQIAVELFTQHNLDRLQEGLVDGVLAMAWDSSTIEAIRRLPKIPVVTLNRMDIQDFSAVATDHRLQAEAAVDYLYSRGHRRIAMLGEERNNWGAEQRMEGFTTAMKAKGLAVDERSIVFTDHQPIYGVVGRLMAGLKPTGIFVAVEDLALEASYILRDVLELKVPQDVSLLGMESSKVSEFVAPPMTTLRQPLDELAERSVECLLSLIESKEAVAPQRIMLESKLIERESVATIPVPTSKAS